MMVQDNHPQVAEETTLRFLTCGHVDDGKSTLIGRLLYDLKKVPTDQLAGAITDGDVNLAQITDGLDEERAKGITIDVAYRYFHHNKRYFIVADAPGHLEYLRNMAVAASNSDVALILLDGYHGLREQTLRHSHVAHLFGIRHFVIVVNKMDAVDYSQERFEEIRKDYLEGFRSQDSNSDEVELTFIPASALVGDNVTQKSDNMLWYSGPTLIEFLSNFELPAQALRTTRVAVQNRYEHEGTSLYQGFLTSGTLSVGDEIYVPDQDEPVTVSTVYHSGKEAKSVNAGASINFAIAENVDLERGMILGAEKNIKTSKELAGKMLWLDDTCDAPSAADYQIKLHHKEANVSTKITPRSDFLHDVTLSAHEALSYEGFNENTHSGQFLLVNPQTNKVQAVGILNS